MRLLFLTIGKRTTPSTRFRVKQYIPLLEADGIKCDVKHIPHAFFKRFRLLGGLKSYDAVIIQKKLFSSLELFFLARANKNLIYDFDDLVTAEHPMHKVTRKVEKKTEKNAKRFKRTLKTVRGVIAGNDFLKEKAKELTNNVAVIPTPVDVKNYKVKNISENDNIVIGWIGTKSNLFYLDHFELSWRIIHEKFPHVTFKVVCNYPYETDTVKVINKEWSAECEEGDILSFDIGIMPLTDDDWSKGKCGFKLLQYMAAGLPTVASDVGANIDIVKHGENGFLAGNEDEWVERITELITDTELRQKLGTNARKLVEENYSIEALKDKLTDAVKRFIKDRRVS